MGVHHQTSSMGIGRALLVALKDHIACQHCHLEQGGKQAGIARKILCWTRSS